MRTEDDLRAALTTLEREAPDARDVLAPLTTPVRRRTIRPMIAVAAATALAVAAVPAFRALTADSTEPAQPGAAFRWEYSYQVDLPSRWTIGYRDVNTKTGQQLMLNTPAGNRCDITIFGPGKFDTGRISPERTPVEVNGRPGYVAKVSGLLSVVKGFEDGKPRSEDVPQTALAWQYATDSWAVSNCDTVGIKPPLPTIIENEKTSAAAVRMTPEPLLIPYRVGYAPKGWEGLQLIAEGRQLAGAPQPDLWLGLGQPGVGKQISVLFSKGVAVTPPAGSRRTTINGNPAWLSGSKDEVTEVFIHWSGYELRIQGPAKYDLVRIARGLELAANPADESTWFDGTVAIP